VRGEKISKMVGLAVVGRAGPGVFTRTNKKSIPPRGRGGRARPADTQSKDKGAASSGTPCSVAPLPRPHQEDWYYGEKSKVRRRFQAKTKAPSRPNNKKGARVKNFRGIRREAPNDGPRLVWQIFPKNTMGAVRNRNRITMAEDAREHSPHEQPCNPREQQGLRPPY